MATEGRHIKLNLFFLSFQGQLRINPKKYHEAFIPAPVSISFHSFCGKI
uniref:Uncharacterized protein n=1 Tax=Anguilla anguilla TaxID=7936 RepID=A0A0E9TC66_ANGAN